MSLVDLQQKYDDFYTPRFTVTIGNEEYPETAGIITDVTVDATLDGANHCTVSMNAPYDHERSRLTDTDWDILSPGQDFAVKMGYADRLQPLFVGSVDSVEPTFPAEGMPTVTVTGYGSEHEMTDGNDSQTWDDATDGEVATDVASAYGFAGVEVDSTTVVRPKVVQDEETDYGFLSRLAERNDDGQGPFEAFARRNTFYFRAPADDATPTLSLGYGDSLQSFEPRTKDAPDVETVEVRHWNQKQRKTIVGSADYDGPGSGKQVVRQPVRSTEEAETVARAKLTQKARERFTGQAETIGLPEIAIGTTIELTGLGDRYSRTYYITDTKHRMSTRGYTTSFDVRLPDGEDLA